MRAGISFDRCQWCDKPVEQGVPGLMGEGLMHPECRKQFDAEESAAWRAWRAANPSVDSPVGMTLHEWMADLKARWSVR